MSKRKYSAVDEVVTDQHSMPSSRGYQMELFEESISKNIIIALPTGTGKTHIAILRIQHYLTYRATKKVAWFLCPTVALSEQQFNVISPVVPAAVLITGRQEPEKWTSTSLWTGVLASHDVVVSTPQVLLDALTHGFIALSTHIGLLVFDEAHHATLDHAYNRIMQTFYHTLKERPGVLGLTASPVCGVQISAEIRQLEKNLDAIVRVPALHATELANHTFPPALRYSTYEAPWDILQEPPLPACLRWLKSVVESLDIEDDPWIKASRKKLWELEQDGHSTSEFRRQIAKVIVKKSTFTHRSIRRLEQTAVEIHWALGDWAVDQYIHLATTQVSSMRRSSWEDEEHDYLLTIVAKIKDGLAPFTESVETTISPKVQALIDTLVREHLECEVSGTPFVGLLFATRRDTVVMLQSILSTHPATKTLFRCGCLVGSSTNAKRETIFDLDSKIDSEQQMILSMFRGLEINLLIATSVAEEGLDIPACGSVVRFDAPPNLRSWIQSQGRARRRHSTYTILIDKNFPDISTSYHSLRTQMEEQCRKERAQLQAISESQNIEESSSGTDENLRFVSETTGATLTLVGSISHLEYFCKTLPQVSYAVMSVQYDYDPPQEYLLLANGAVELPSPKGPFKATVTLPSLLPPHLRSFTTERTYSSKISAKRHIAFEAYIALFREGLLNDHLLPHNFDRMGEGESVSDLKRDIEKRDGLTRVVHQLDPWTSTAQTEEWHLILVEFSTGDSLQMFTRSSPFSELLEPISFPLYEKGREGTIISFSYKRKMLQSEFDFEKAVKFTRGLFWSLWSAQMEWTTTEYSYLFLPSDSEQTTNIAKDHAEEMSQDGQSILDSELPPFPWLVKAKGGARFLVRGVRQGLLDEEELEAVKKHQLGDHSNNATNVYFEAFYFPRRSNFLSKPAEQAIPRARELKMLNLLPSKHSVDVTSGWLLRASMILPSALEGLSHILVASSLKKDLFCKGPLAGVPQGLLLNAILSSGANAEQDYQRLETLGDSVLKLVTSLNLLQRHRYWHEGYLSRAKDHIVANSTLAKASLSRDLAKYIIRRQFAGRKWAPHLDVTEANEKRERITAELLSTKILADVVESLIGACFLAIGLDGVIVFLRHILPQKDLAWLTLPEGVQCINDRTEAVDPVPPQVESVEKMIGWSFSRKRHILEALTHASHHQGNAKVVSYERMEFLGDAVLDYLVASLLHKETDESFGPALLHKSKIALVNADLLGYLCLDLRSTRIRTMSKKVNGEYILEEQEEEEYFWKYLLHSSPKILDSQSECFLRYLRLRPSIDEALHNGESYPWTDLASLQLPKLYSDVIESVLGAVYLDSEGDFEACKSVLIRIGVMGLLERIIRREISIRHPITVIHEWTALRQSVSYGYIFEESAGITRCKFVVDQDVVAYEELAGGGPTVKRALQMRCAQSAAHALNISPRS